MNARTWSISFVVLLAGLQTGCRIQRLTHEAEVNKALTRPANAADNAIAAAEFFDLAPISADPAPARRERPRSPAPDYGTGDALSRMLSTEPYSVVDEIAATEPTPAAIMETQAVQPAAAQAPEQPAATLILPTSYAAETIDVAPEKPAHFAVQTAAHETAPAPAAGVPAAHNVQPRAPAAVLPASQQSPAPAAVQPASHQVVPHAPVAALTPGSSETIVNSRVVVINYRVGRVGPSGLGKVDVWGSNDEGHTWQRLNTDAATSPLQIELPSDGRWGLRMAATNGNGFGGTPPRRGDQPGFVVEVDTTTPRVHLGSVEPNADGQSLQLRWNAEDSNFGREPIALYYRAHEGPWQLLADKVGNTGEFCWQYPRDKGSQFFFRVQATDRAGNQASSDAPAAVTLDMTVPSLVVVGVTGSGQLPGTNP